MSLYNMVMGVNPSTFFILPMLDQHPDSYPRFRDCFVHEVKFAMHDGLPIPTKKKSTRKNIICVFTRVGGGNRPDYEKEIAELRKKPGYITDYDDKFDCTFASFIYSVPKKWKEDYDAICNEDFLKVSDTYIDHIIKVFPLLKDKISKLFEEIRQKNGKKSKSGDRKRSSI